MTSHPPGYVDALLRERAGMVQARRVDRLRAIDAELARFGVAVDDAPEAAVEAATERAVMSAPEPRMPTTPNPGLPEKRPRGRPRKVINGDR